LRQDESNNEAVEAQSFRENENKDHADEKLLLLSHRAHSCVAYDADAHTGRQA